MLLQKLVEFIAPAECLSCDAQGNWLCDGCLATVANCPQRCYACERPSPDGRTCGSCVDSTLSGVAVAAHYDGPVKDMILRLKFDRARSAAVPAAKLLRQRLPRGIGYDVVTAVPIGPARYRERGYNQAELIARRVARELGLPYRSLLGRVDSAHQLGRSRKERLEQISGVFYAIGDLPDQRILVVDDVTTTGATLAECAVALKGAGAATVWGAAVARH